MMLEVPVGKGQIQPFCFSSGMPVWVIINLYRIFSVLTKIQGIFSLTAAAKVS